MSERSLTSASAFFDDGTLDDLQLRWMEPSLRELDRLRDRDDSAARRATLVILATAMIAALIVSVAVLVRRSTAPPHSPSDDPLAALGESVDSVTPRTAASPAPAAVDETARQAPTVARSELTFPDTLSDQVPPAEVEAAIAAAAAEMENPDSLAVSPPVPTTQTAPPAAPVAAVLGTPTEPARHAPTPTQSQTPTRARPHLPAAADASPSRASLQRSVRRDPLIAAALPREAPGETAPVGHDGPYVLQVIAYLNTSQAQEFAHGLRQRGHTAFVTSANIPDRGTHFRVRLGPFPTLARAAQYARTFEAAEQIHPIIVRSQD